MKNNKYKIVRMYADGNIPSETIETGLTLEAAQIHCKDPETSSQTCEGFVGTSRTTQFGHWFDGYEEE